MAKQLKIKMTARHFKIASESRHQTKVKEGKK